MNQLDKAKSYMFKSGHELYKEGDPISGLSIFFLKKGKVELTYKINNAKEFKIFVPSSGLFGVFETLSGENYRIMNARFVEDSQVYLWEKDDFFIDVGMKPELGLKCIMFLSAFLRTLNQKIQELG